MSSRAHESQDIIQRAGYKADGDVCAPSQTNSESTVHHRVAQAEANVRKQCKYQGDERKREVRLIDYLLYLMPVEDNHEHGQHD